MSNIDLFKRMGFCGKERVNTIGGEYRLRSKSASAGKQWEMGEYDKRGEEYRLGRQELK